MNNKKLVLFLVIISVIIMVGTSMYGGLQNTGNNKNTPAASSIAQQGTIYVSPGPSPAFVHNFNPFNIWTSPAGIMSLFYEPLLQINTYNGTVTPWLATNYTWQNHSMQLVLDLRHNVKFSNGMAFNSSDVVYMFNEQKTLFKQWPDIKNITAKNQYTVDFNFTTKNTQCLFYIGSNFMIPKQIWQGVSHPQNKVVKNPIGTGPYVLSSFSGQKITLTANPHYWQPNEPHIKHVVYVDYTSASALTLALERGQVQWTSAFEPNITTLMTSKNPNAHYWFPSGQPVTMITNDTMYPLNMSYFREALSLSINRTKLCKIGEYGYEKPANAANILQQQLSYLNSTNRANAASLAAYHPHKALHLLLSHGFSLKDYHNKMRLYEPNGTRLPAINLMTPASFPDWATDISIIASNLAKIGIKVTTTTPTLSSVDSQVESGKFQMALVTVTGVGPNPWYDYSNFIGAITPTGKTATVNEERWNYTGTGFQGYYKNFSKTSNPSTQGKLINDMASVMIKQMPMIPLVYSADWYEYINSTIKGFPDKNNPYGIPMPWYPGPMEIVMLHLYSTATSNKAVNPYLSYEIAGGIIAIAVAIPSLLLYSRKRRRGQD
jgi:peptide/nickel transport system substrate-binding protein